MKSKKKKKARMGRPPMGRDGRNISVMIRVSANEKAAWGKAARAEDMGLGPWIAKPRRDDTGRERSS